MGVAAAVLTGVTVGAAPASALDSSVIGTHPAVVAVGGVGGKCTGVQVSESVILTAAHCGLKAGAGFSYANADGRFGPYELGAIDKVTSSAAGDVAVLHLAQPHPLASYPRVDLDYKPTSGHSGLVYGAGLPFGGDQRVAPVSVVTSGRVIAGGPTIQVRFPGGGVGTGDSGGPLIVDNAVVGVLYGGSGNDAYYSQLSSTENAALVASQLPGTAVGDRSTTPYQFELRNVASGLALSAANGSAHAGAESAQGTFTGAKTQQWALQRNGSHVRLINRGSQNVLGVSGGSRSAGANAILWTSIGVTDQDWDMLPQSDGSYVFRNANSGQVLVPQGGSTSPDARVVQAPATGGAAEQWRLVTVG
jgi:hypothetical protein